MPYNTTDAITAGYKKTFETVLTEIDAERAHNYVLTAMEGLQDYDRFHRDYEEFAERNGIEYEERDPWLDRVNDELGYEDERLEQEAFGLEFPNPVGVAAGLDKNARLPEALAAIGFGYVEVGGVTSHPQDGNPRPRVHRLEDENAVVNSMGFPNDGADAVAERLARYDGGVPVGVNLGESHELPYTETATDAFSRLQDQADYFTVNVSCPNVDDDEDLQDADELSQILGAVQDANTADTPLLVKISPDLSDRELYEAIDVAMDYDMAGIVATNTTTQDNVLEADDDRPDGGISGDPLYPLTADTVEKASRYADDDCAVVAVGGISTADDAYQMILNGADLVQLYTGMVYEGPAIAHNINKGVAERLEDDGFDSVTDAVSQARN